MEIDRKEESVITITENIRIEIDLDSDRDVRLVFVFAGYPSNNIYFSPDSIDEFINELAYYSAKARGAKGND